MAGQSILRSSRHRRLDDAKPREVSDGDIVRVEGNGWLYDYDTISAFIINHECANGDVAFSFNALSQNGGVEKKSLVAGQWDAATSSSWPSGLSASTAFKLDFSKDEQAWKVSLNGAALSSLDFTSSASCKVVSTSITPNVRNGRVMLIPLDEVTVLGMDGPSAVIHMAILVVIILVTAIAGCICGRAFKARFGADDATAQDAEEKQWMNDEKALLQSPSDVPQPEPVIEDTLNGSSSQQQSPLSANDLSQTESPPCQGDSEVIGASLLEVDSPKSKPNRKASRGPPTSNGSREQTVPAKTSVLGVSASSAMSQSPPRTVHKKKARAKPANQELDAKPANQEPDAT